jgi:hypothetical protein
MYVKLYVMFFLLGTNTCLILFSNILLKKTCIDGVSKFVFHYSLRVSSCFKQNKKNFNGWNQLNLNYTNIFIKSTGPMLHFCSSYMLSATSASKFRVILLKVGYILSILFLSENSSNNSPLLETGNVKFPKKLTQPPVLEAWRHSSGVVTLWTMAFLGRRCRLFLCRLPRTCLFLPHRSQCCHSDRLERWKGG